MGLCTYIKNKFESDESDEIPYTIKQIGEKYASIHDKDESEETLREWAQIKFSNKESKRELVEVVWDLDMLLEKSERSNKLSYGRAVDFVSYIFSLFDTRKDIAEILNIMYCDMRQNFHLDKLVDTMYVDQPQFKIDVVKENSFVGNDPSFFESELTQEEYEIKRLCNRFEIGRDIIYRMMREMILKEGAMLMNEIDLDIENFVHSGKWNQYSDKEKYGMIYDAWDRIKKNNGCGDTIVSDQDKIVDMCNNHVASVYKENHYSMRLPFLISDRNMGYRVVKDSTSVTHEHGNSWVISWYGTYVVVNDDLVTGPKETTKWL